VSTQASGPVTAARGTAPAAGPGEGGAISIDLLTDPAGVPRARAMLQRAEWAARAFARYSKPAVDRIVHAAAEAAAAKASEYAERAVRETGFGVAAHKAIKNLACSTGLVDAYRGHDYVTPRFDPVAKILEIPRPAGVIFALTPSTNPVATVYFKTLLALMTRSAVVISPHPLAREVCADAARTLAAAAVAAGAPDGVIQVVDEPSVPLINALMTDERTRVIVATGGVPVVRAAYSSGTPAIGVGPGNVPVLVDATADLAKAAKRITDSKSFDNSILCTSESVLIVEEAAAAGLLRHLKREGAHLLDAEGAAKVAGLLFPGGHFDIGFVGKDATAIASAAGLRVPGSTRVLLAPLRLAVPEEPLAHEKLCPVLGLLRVPSAERGIEAARAVLRIGGRGHSAAIHSTDPATVMEFGAAVEVLRVSVNAGNSLGSSGIETNLAPSMTVGTGYFGGSSLRANLEPGDLVQWTRLAYNRDMAETFGDFTGLDPWMAPAGPVPAYPVASNARTGRAHGHPGPGSTPGPGDPASALPDWARGGGGVAGAGGPEYGSGGREVAAGPVPGGSAWPGGVGGDEAGHPRGSAWYGGVGDGGSRQAGSGPGLDVGALREEIRRLVIEELARFVGERRG
jgi:acetaldehyde dehydrogenase / alcohol dehydrogenase